MKQVSEAVHKQHLQNKPKGSQTSPDVMSKFCSGLARLLWLGQVMQSFIPSTRFIHFLLHLHLVLGALP